MHLSQLLLELTSVVRPFRVVVIRVGMICDVIDIATSHMKIVDYLIDFIRRLAFKHLLVHLFGLTIPVISLLIDLDLILIFDIETVVLIC